MALVPTTTVVEALAADDDATVAAATGLRLVGWNVRETGAAAANFDIVHGATAAGGTKLVPIVLAADAKDQDWFWPGIDCSDGISIVRTAGAADIILHTINTPEG